MNYLAGLAFHRSMELDGREANNVSLSGRERECLSWTAEGKTSVEIATILGLSEHTINNYLASACRRLNAVTRAHAVAKAMRCRIVS